LIGRSPASSRRPHPTSESSTSTTSRRCAWSARHLFRTQIPANANATSRSPRISCHLHVAVHELSPFCHLARKSAAVIPRHLSTRLIPQKPFDGVIWAEVFHEMDEGT